jgi:8-oxo-dGTP pyrophosphatase MutT (NUDIX family)
MSVGDNSASAGAGAGASNSHLGRSGADCDVIAKAQKDKDIAERIYDTDGYKKRAACVCVRNERENEVLLISSSRNKHCWIIPGGGIEDNENPEDAAEREVYEEAGVQGRLGRLLGVFEVFLLLNNLL